MMSNPFSFYFYVFIVKFRVGWYQIWKNNGHLGRTYWSNADMATFGNQQFLRLLNHHLRKTGGPLRLGEYIFTCLKHQYQQQQKNMWIKSTFKLVHFGMPTVSLNMESTKSFGTKFSLHCCTVNNQFYVIKWTVKKHLVKQKFWNMQTCKDDHNFISVMDSPVAADVNLLIVEVWYVYAINHVYISSFDA